jgi:hypothetical protein
MKKCLARHGRRFKITQVVGDAARRLSLGVRSEPADPSHSIFNADGSWSTNRATSGGTLIAPNQPTGLPTMGKHDGNRMNMKRMRGRNHRSGGGGGGGGGGVRHHPGSGVPLNRNHVFDSNGPDVRIRGTAQQLFEKYLQLGRDATSSGDRVTAEGFFQHAEHYFRILNAMNQAAQQGQSNPQGQNPGGNRRNYQHGDAYQANDDGPPGGQDTDDPESRTPGMGDQPDAREIPIAAAPPEG